MQRVVGMANHPARNPFSDERRSSFEPNRNYRSDYDRDYGRDRDWRDTRVATGDHRDWHDRDFASDNERDDRFMRDSADRGAAWRGAGNMGASYARPRGPHYGKGPQGYTRSDERIKELVSEALHDDEYVDASNLTVQVSNGEVTLAGTVDDRAMKRMAEDCALRVSGVRDVQNQIRVVHDKTSRTTPTLENAGAKHLS